MSAISDTGHAKNVTNFDKLLTSVNALGVTYNPSRNALKLTALQELSSSARETLSSVNLAFSAFKNAEAARELEFKPFSRFITRVINALKATDAPAEVVEKVKEIVRKLQGKRATPKKTEEQKKALADSGIEVKEISSSQLSYENRLQNFDKLIKILSGIPEYAPNEADLQIPALIALLNNMKTKNSAVINASVELNNARIARNKVLYKDKSGLIDQAMDIKAYIKSLFDASSPQYKQISKLSFERFG
jgi:hypothetical protein